MMGGKTTERCIQGVSMHFIAWNVLTNKVLKAASSSLKLCFRYAPVYILKYILVLNLVFTVVLNEDFLK